MILADANVLVCALRKDAPQHATCRRWLDGVVSEDARFGVSPLVLSAVVRIATDPRVFREPSTRKGAFGFCEDLLDQPHCQIVEPGERHWDIFRRLCRDADARGARVAHAWFAALAVEWGCEWITLDRSYAAFPGLRWAGPTER